MKLVDVFVHKTTKKIMLLIAGALIVATSIITKQHPIRVLPLFVSLFVMLYQTEARRSAYLIGGLNAALYACIYFFYFKLYGVKHFEALCHHVFRDFVCAGHGQSSVVSAFNCNSGS